MKQKRIKISLLVFSVLLLFGSAPVYAAESLSNSAGSAASDYSASEDDILGVDLTQSQQTEYATVVEDSAATEESRSESVAVYATQASTYCVVIPKTIILDGDTGVGEYQVGVKGDISGSQSVSVIPVSQMTLTQQGKEPITALISQKSYGSSGEEKTQWTCSEINLSEYTLQSGFIEAELSAGSWNGTFDFTITLTNES